MTESRFTQSWIKKFKKRNPEAFVMKMMIPTCAGFPDIMILSRGRVSFIEVKYASTTPVRSASKLFKHRITGIQQKFLRQLREAGATCHILLGVQDSGHKLIAIDADTDFEAINNMTLGEW